MKKILCPLTGINILPAILAMVAGFVAIFVLDYAIHGVLLADLYNESADLWRGQEDMMKYFPYMIGVQAFTAVMLTKIYAIFSHKQNWAEGLLFGGMAGIMVGALQASTYIYMPIPLDLSFYWLAGTFTQFAIVGALIGLIYKK